MLLCSILTMNISRRIVSCTFGQSRKRFVTIEAQHTNKWIKPTGYDTGINIYNPITKCKVPFIIKNKNIVQWYMCGPTVYDIAHIGHAMTYVKSDIIHRVLTDYFKIDVLLVMCITDIDDKIINVAHEKNQSYQELARFYESDFYKDMHDLNVRQPSVSKRVTEHIPEIINFIEKIIAQGNAYVGKDGSVYFDTRTYDKYGKLNTPFEESSHPDKRSTLDFTLWKASKLGEPYWQSPWGTGRPGWHIECSAIASSVFKNSIDIHSGGIDLIFPHHENEEAQSCCYHGVDQWVNYWLHTGHLYLKGDVKMSKSLKNTISIKDFLKKYTANEFRTLCLLTKYEHGIEFSDEVMKIAVSSLHGMQNFIMDCNNYITGTLLGGNIDECSLLQHLDETKNAVHKCLNDNFNTAQALHEIIKLVKFGNKMIHEKSGTSTSKSIIAIAAVSNYVSKMLSMFGISHSQLSESDQRLENIINHFIKFRSDVRNRLLQHNVTDKVLLSACDEARSNLKLCGVQVKDQKNTSTWSIEK